MFQSTPGYLAGRYMRVLLHGPGLDAVSIHSRLFSREIPGVVRQAAVSGEVSIHSRLFSREIRLLLRAIAGVSKVSIHSRLFSREIPLPLPFSAP